MVRPPWSFSTFLQAESAEFCLRQHATIASPIELLEPPSFIRSSASRYAGFVLSDKHVSAHFFPIAGPSCAAAGKFDAAIPAVKTIAKVKPDNLLSMLLLLAPGVTGNPAYWVRNWVRSRYLAPSAGPRSLNYCF